MNTLDALQFDNRFARLPEPMHTRLNPTPVPEPYLVSANPDGAALIGLDPAEFGRREFVEAFAGNRPLAGADPLAALYSGHQFGHYVSQLGDGRAILLGEAINAEGARWEIQIKGAGKTPYSRGGDGRAVLRSSIREYLCSEAMHGLGIPTTRALCVVGTDLPVYREEDETGAVVTRLSPSFIRFGSFEVLFYRKQHDLLKTLADFTIEHYFPHLAGQEDVYALWLKEVVERTARLMAQWQAVGFCHGVMNTDNMSILGLTLDYGPFGFMEAFDPGYICNHSDDAGRYAYDQQPDVGAWNCTCLAQALTPLMGVDAATSAIEGYPHAFTTHYVELMAAKLGLQPEQEVVDVLIRLLDLLAQDRSDYTLFFRNLCQFDMADGALNSALRDTFLDRESFDAWAGDYAALLRRQGRNQAERQASMRAVNPKYVLRNYLAEMAIRKAADEKDYSEVDRLLTLLRKPFDEQPEFVDYAKAPPDWASKIEVSCSS
ncbi:MAG TPA: YdiU family protein [Thiobacillaceae bacterium]|nr:YdiU family protein [Thiobacillaceae bacterium]